MPHHFPFTSRESEDIVRADELPPPPKRAKRTSFIKNLGHLWKRQHQPDCPLQSGPLQDPRVESPFQQRRSSLPDTTTPILDRNVQSKAIPSLPRPQTFHRQQSERREKVQEIPATASDKRTLSLDRRRSSGARRPLSPKPVPLPSVSAPDVVNSDEQPAFQPDESAPPNPSRSRPDLPPLQIPDPPDFPVEIGNDDEEEDEIDRDELQQEYDRRWILNLSMHFRDKSNREKFFVTYAETPTNWRRLTVSLDYRNALPDSLEADLSTLHYQRDKSFRIYEAIRESLPDVQFYSTVTNLKLETTAEDQQLHVHVREDANEIVTFPSLSLFAHVHTEYYRESDVEFISHLSGFVYKVRAGGKTVIKKEIPGSDTIDEFLYEVNALDSLVGCRHVIQLEGLVTDNTGSVVKGLLISYASKGAMVDMLYDWHGTAELPWHRREKWARQIVQGLSAIHEAGFVQGDFTLSNIVIDENDNAQIIDINRRGCPVGWEPPELSRLINSGQRIAMNISVKTDMFQLGMVLWALAEEVDEPERLERPLARVCDTAPVYFSEMIENCLSEHPQGRSSAKKLLRHFPPSAGFPPSHHGVEFAAAEADEIRLSDASTSTTHRSDKEYIDPRMAVTLDDVTRRGRRPPLQPLLSPFSSGQVQYVDPQDPDSNPASSESWVLAHRARSPVSSRPGRHSPVFVPSRADSSATSVSRSPPSRGYRRRGSDCSDQDTGLVPLRAVETNGLGIDFAGDNSPNTEAEPLEAPPLDMGVATGEAETEAQDKEPLLHKDSGFDEVMVNEIESGATSDLHTIKEDTKGEVASRQSSHAVDERATSTPPALALAPGLAETEVQSSTFESADDSHDAEAATKAQHEFEAPFIRSSLAAQEDLSTLAPPPANEEAKDPVFPGSLTTDIMPPTTCERELGHTHDDTSTDMQRVNEDNNDNETRQITNEIMTE